MRELLIAVSLLAVLCSTVMAGPEEEALQVVRNWEQAFTQSDVDGIVRLYASDALFLGTGSKTVATRPEEIRDYFQVLKTSMPRTARLGDHSVLVLSDSAVIVTGLDTLTEVRDGKTYSANGRVSFVIARRGSEWKIVHFHRSNSTIN